MRTLRTTGESWRGRRNRWMLMKRYETRTTASRFAVGTGCAHLLGRGYGGLTQ